MLNNVSRFATGAILLAGLIHAQDSLVKLIVTVEAHGGKTPPVLHREDVVVHQGDGRARVLGWTPLQGDLQLYILIDDGLDSSVGSQLSDLRKFILALPAATRIGVGYIRNGAVGTVQELTADHAAAAKSLRLPIGAPGSTASPYLGLSDLLKKWPESSGRREVLMVTSGIDLYNVPGSDNPDVTRAIQDAQRGSVVVFSIYYGAEGHAGHSYWRLNWAESHLAQLSEETGGESYWQGFSNPVSFAPYLDNLSRKLGQQYLLTFEAKPRNKAGSEPLKLTTEVPHVDLLSADKVWVTPAH